MSSSTREETKQYLVQHQIPQMLEALLSSLMIERPEDPVVFIEDKMAQIKEIGVHNVNWETFVYHLHPYRDGIRRILIRDKSKFNTEYERDNDLESTSENLMHTENHYSYQPEVFQLTET